MSQSFLRINCFQKCETPISTNTVSENSNDDRCVICSKGLGAMSVQGKLQHTTRCILRQESGINYNKNVDRWQRTIDCPICDEPLAPDGPFRTTHLKRCAAVSNVKTCDLIKLVDSQRKIAEVRREKGLPHTRLLRPVQLCTTKEKRDRLLPRSQHIEDLQNAMALSLSDCPDSICSAGNIADSKQSLHPASVTSERPVALLILNRGEKEEIISRRLNAVLEELYENSSCLAANLELPIGATCSLKWWPRSVSYGCVCST